MKSGHARVSRDGWDRPWRRLYGQSNAVSSKELQLPARMVTSAGCGLAAPFFRRTRPGWRVAGGEEERADVAVLDGEVGDEVGARVAAVVGTLQRRPCAGARSAVCTANSKVRMGR